MSKKVLKVRLSVTLTKPYVDALCKLVEDGIYLNTGDAIRQSLKMMFEREGVSPFKAHQ